MFKQKIQTKIASISQEKNLLSRLFGVFELFIISLVWIIFSILFYFPQKLIISIQAKLYARAQLKRADRKLRYLDLREMKAVKISRGETATVKNNVIPVKTGIQSAGLSSYTRFPIRSGMTIGERWEKFVSAVQDELIHLLHFRINKKDSKKFAFDIAIVSLILVIIFQFSHFGSAATYYNTWSSTADFDSNQSTIEKGGQNTGLSLPTTKTSNITTASNEVKMTEQSATKTENSFNDFSNGTNTNTILDNNAIKTAPTALANTWSSPGTIGRGAQMIHNGSEDNAYVLQGNYSTGFYKYSFSSNSWTVLANVPASVGLGGAMIRNGADDDIYVLVTNGYFYKYSISANAWIRLADLPAIPSGGGRMIRSESDRYIYVMRGYGTTDFWKYDIANNSWTTLAVLPGTTGDAAGFDYGSAMARNGQEDYIYVLRGNGSTAFYRYSISANSWDILSSLPASISIGSAMIRDKSSNFIYVLRGANGPDFYRYSISANSWTALTSAPASGASEMNSAVSHQDFSDDIYYLQGNSGTGFYKYSISTNTWSTLAVFPVSPGNGNAIIRGGDDAIYALQGGGTGFYKYSISGNSWTNLTLAKLPVTPGDGAQMLRNGSDNDIYVLQGAGGTGFYKYSISGNSWTTLTAVPGGPYAGAQMIRNGSDNDIYVLRGSGQTSFYKYSISGNSWSDLTSIPGGVGVGGTMIRNGSDDNIYILQGNNATGFYKYSISGNSWTTLTVVPNNVGSGASMIRNGSDNDIYILQGGNASGFYKYSISGNSWTTLTSVPGATVSAGGAAIREGSDDAIYVIIGGYTNVFYKYSISGNSWTNLATTPGAINGGNNAGGHIVRDGDSIYLLQKSNTIGFYRYSISANMWITLPNIPGNVNVYVGKLLYNSLEQSIYVLPGYNGDLFRYSLTSRYPSSGTFESQTIDLGTTANLSTVNIQNNAWQKYPNYVISLSAAGDDTNAAFPSVIKESPTSYKMWYNSTNVSSQWYNIMYATSSDGITWTKGNSGNKVFTAPLNGSWDNATPWLGSVIKDGTNVVTPGTQYKMYYSCYGADLHYRGCYAESADEITWTVPNLGLVNYGGNTNNNIIMDVGADWDSDRTMGGKVIKDGSTYKMWYLGSDTTNAQKYSVGYATSNDGINWSNRQKVLDRTWEVNIFTVSLAKISSSDYRLAYGCSDGSIVRQCYATSTNGTTWTKPNIGQVSFGGSTANNIIMDVGQPGSNTVYSNERGDLFYDSDDGKLKLWRSISVSGAKWSISYAELPEIKYQIAANNDNSTWNYIGPDGTNTTYFTSLMSVSGASSMDIPASLDGSRYVRYKAFFNGTPQAFSTQTLSDISINYSQYTHDAGKIFEANFNNSDKANYSVGSPYALSNENTTYDQDGKFGQGVHIDAGVNLVRNSSFEYGITGYPWVKQGTGDQAGLTESADSSYVYDGSKSLKMDASISAAGQYIDIETYPNDLTVTGSTTYTFSLYSKGGPGKMQIYQRDGTADDGACVSGNCVKANRSNMNAAIPAAADWTRTSFTFTTSSDCTSLSLFFIQNKNDVPVANPIYVDAVQFEQSSTATPYKKNGPDVLKYSAAKSNNLITSNSGFESGIVAPWISNGGVNVTSDSTEHYEGSYSVRMNTSSLGTGQAYDVATTGSSSYMIPVIPNETYTYSVYTKGGPATLYVVEYKSDKTNTTTYYKDHNTSVSANSNWARTSVSFTTQADAAWVHLYLRQFKDATPVYFDAVQFEQGDLTNYNSASTNINPTEGSIEFWFKPDWSADDSTPHVFLQTSNNSSGGSIRVIKGGGNCLNFSIYDTVSTYKNRIYCATEGFLLTAGNWYHTAATYDSSGNLRLYFNGQESQALAPTNYSNAAGTGSGIVTSIGSDLFIGSSPGNTQYANASIDNLRIYNRVLSDNEVMAHANATSEAENVGVISNLKMHEPSDATTIWSELDWSESAPAGTNVKFRTRSASTEGGLSSATWSGYYDDPSGSAISGTPDASWIEIETSLSTSTGTGTPTLSSFQLTYNVNGPPVITVNSAVQSQEEANFGKVIIDYSITDVDNTNEQIFLFYQPQSTTLTGAIQSADQPPQTVSVNSTTGFPSSGTLSIGNETFTYDSKTSTSFNVTVRHTIQNEKAQSHSIGAEVFVQANPVNVTGLGAKTLNAGSPNSLSNQSIVWDVATELPSVYYPTAKIRVLADDNEYVYSTGTGDYALVIDTTDPASTSIAIENSSDYTNDYVVDLNLAATDGSAVKVKISNSIDGNGNIISDGLNLNSGQWIDYSATISNWNLPANGDGSYTVYYQFRDIYGNSVAQTSDTIIKSSPPTIDAFSISQAPDGIFTINYTLSDAIAPPTGQTHFNVYAKYSKTGQDVDLETIGSEDALAVSGDIGSASVNSAGAKSFTWTPRLESFSSGITRISGTHKFVLYVDDRNASVAEGNIQRLASNPTTNFALDTEGPVQSYFYIDSDADGLDNNYIVNSTSVNLVIDATDSSNTIKYRVGNTTAERDAALWSNFSINPLTILHTLVSGDGKKTVYVQLKDAFDNVTSLSNEIYITSPPTVAVNGVAQSQDADKIGKVYIDYNISDAVQSNLNVVMKYSTDGSTWNAVTNVTNAGVQTITPGQTTNLISVWDAKTQLGSDSSENAAVRFRVYASDGNSCDVNYASCTILTDDPANGEVQYNPYDEIGADPNTPETFVLDLRNPQASGSAISISGKTGDGKIGQIQLSEGISLDLSVTDISSMKVQFSNDGNKFGISTDSQGSVTGAYSDILAGADDASAWLDYALGNGLSWTPDKVTQGDKTVYVRVKDAYGNTAIFSDTAILDTEAPTPPHFIVVDSSYYGIRYWVTVGWDLFNGTDNPDEYADLAAAGTAYQIERKIINKDGQIVDNGGVVLGQSIQDDPDTYYQANPLVAYPKDTTQDSLIDKDLLAYDEDNLFTYYYRVETRDSVGNFSNSGWQTIIPQGLDTVPPAISSNGPSAESTSTAATISWITDKLSNSIVQFSSSSNYDSNDPTNYKYEQGKSDDIETIHAVEIIGLQPATTYHYRVKSVSAFGKEAFSSDKTFTTALPEDSLIDPIIYTPEVQTLGTSADSVTVTFKTDKYSYSQIRYGKSENNLDLETVLSTNLNKDHWVTILSLDPGTKYYFKARSVDTYGNEVLGPLQNFTTATSNADAAISAVVVSDITMSSAIISWTSDTVTKSEVKYGKSTSYGSVITDISSSSTTIHTVKLQNLEEGTTYHFRISGTADDDTSVNSDDYVFDTITLPEVKNIRFTDITENGLTASWATNVPTDSQVEYKLGENTPRIEAITDLATVHSVKLQNLESNSSYSIRVIVRDAFGNQVISLPVSIKTNVDSTGPKITQVKAETAASLSQEGKVQAIISWNTNEASTTQVIYSLGSQGNYDKQSSKDENLATSHIVIVPELAGSSTYHYKVVSIDKAGNKTESNDYTILTPRKKNSLLQIIVNNMEQEFGWLKKFGVFQ